MKQILKTACNRDCPDACSIEAEVLDGRLIALKGSKSDPVTQGFLCPRTTKFVDRQASVDRLRTPLLRDSEGQYQAISWERALDVATQKLRETKSQYGAESIFHYQSGGAMGFLKSLVGVFFDQFGPVAVKRGDICSGAGEWAQETDFGVSDSSDPQDLLNSKLIIVWGKNIHTSSVHLLPTILAAKKAGAKIVGIDPVPTRTARISDLFLCPRPGTDGQLALALVSYLADNGRLEPQAGEYCVGLEGFLEMATAVSFEERVARCGLKLEDALEFARLYDELRPSSLLVGWGAPRRANGAKTVRVMDALAAVSGNIGVPGACVSFYFQRKRGMTRENLPASVEPPRSFSEARLGLELEQADPPVRLAWITAGNPAAMLPDSEKIAEQLKRIDFTVVVDTHWTDSAACADLVLPTLTLVEDEDVLGAYGNPYLRASQPVVKPEGEAKNELWIHQQLASRLGFGEVLAGSPQEWKEKLLRPEVDRAIFEGQPVRQPGAPTIVFENRVFQTADQKVHLTQDDPGVPEEVTEAFPFRLMALSHPDAQSSQWAVEPPEIPLAQISAEAPSEFEDGALLQLESRKGGFPVRIARKPGLHPEVVLLPKGGSGVFGGWCPNDLIEGRETDFGGGGCFYEEPVRLVHRP